MPGVQTNPYALYVHCDAAMDYDSRNSGGVGLEIVFPDSIDLEIIQKSIGRYEGANIERLELEAILQGMNEVVKLFDTQADKLQDVNTIIITTDRYSLNDKDKTNPYRIRDWRKNKWCNHEGKAIKNKELLDKLDKTRGKVISKTSCSLEIKYQRSKYNKAADKLAKKGKKLVIKKDDIASKGIKMGKRKYEGDEINYNHLKSKDEYIIHVYKKEPVSKQWEINVEFCEGEFFGRKLKIYTENGIENKLHRHHKYKIRIKKVYSHHVVIFKTIEEIKDDQKHD